MDSRRANLFFQLVAIRYTKAALLITVPDHPKAARNDHFKTGQWGRAEGILAPS
jgi:hypothetical protein